MVVRYEPQGTAARHSARKAATVRVSLIVPEDLAEIPIRLVPTAIKQSGGHLKNIFVGNLDFGATEESIRSLFEQYGSVESVRLMTDRATGRSRGFAFVEMTDSDEADRAITALNGTNIGGRALNVNEARPKEDRGGRGGGFRGGRGGPPRQRREPRW
jgi:cold-inducible RNA-binding protein